MSRFGFLWNHSAVPLIDTEKLRQGSSKGSFDHLRGSPGAGEILPKPVMKPDFDTEFGSCHQWTGLGSSALLDEAGNHRLPKQDPVIAGFVELQSAAPAQIQTQCGVGLMGLQSA